QVRARSRRRRRADHLSGPGRAGLAARARPADQEVPAGGVVRERERELLVRRVEVDAGGHRVAALDPDLRRRALSWVHGEPGEVTGPAGGAAVGLDADLL